MKLEQVGLSWILGAALVAWAAVGTPLAAAKDGAEESHDVAESLDPSTLLPNGRQPFENVVTGGQPTVEGLQQASELGFRTVINLRTPGESPIGQEAVEAAGMSYVSIPVSGASGLTRENAQALAEALNQAEGPVLVHCGSGNRVGALFALKAYHVDNASPEAALAVGIESGLTRLKPAVRKHLGLETD